MKERLLADELCRYLLRLDQLLQQRGASALAESVQSATHFAAGSTTELYAAAEKVLTELLIEHPRVLREKEITELCGVIEGIKAEFKMIGGA